MLDAAQKGAANQALGRRAETVRKTAGNLTIGGEAGRVMLNQAQRELGGCTSRGCSSRWRCHTC